MLEDTVEYMWGHDTEANQDEAVMNLWISSSSVKFEQNYKSPTFHPTIIFVEAFTVLIFSRKEGLLHFLNVLNELRNKRAQEKAKAIHFQG